jgi:hypothetical protein
MFPTLNSPSSWRRYWWLAAFGAALPYAVTVVGWWLVKLFAPDWRDDTWWNTADTSVNVATLIALVACIAFCWPLLRLAKAHGWLLLIAVLAVPYIGVLFVINFFAYFEAGGPFP